ncbi:hypothetical protein G7Y89_g41 [Cudoniella acicularis]|uniref:Uncharacterized protein n=1 Tax=Cudoniella acicularis TaxID=354080 RepID=A0A8H4RZK2_9HELO|nr:hypothetical protein G7Y89_g41 [Cudoniella acicularis]
MTSGYVPPSSFSDWCSSFDQSSYLLSVSARDSDLFGCQVAASPHRSDVKPALPGWLNPASNCFSEIQIAIPKLSPKPGPTSCGPMSPLKSAFTVTIVSNQSDDGRRIDHDESSGDDDSQIEHGPQHPGAVLVNFQALNIIIGHADGDCHQNHQGSDSALNVKCSPKGPAGSHESSNVGQEDENDDDVSVDAVEDKKLVTDDGTNCQIMRNPDGRHVARWRVIPIR